ncbi:MAG: DNA polymerase III subunit chi [Proteobacteria bacterium]|nr:DNA polymerase III subunit chi [Pseudomonadota bacterium]
MPEYNIYQLAAQPAAKAMPKFVEMVLNTAKKRVVILCSSTVEVKECDNLLWSYAQLSFMPHGTHADPYKQEQLVYITQDLADRANNAEVLLLYNAAAHVNHMQSLVDTVFEKVIVFIEPAHEVLMRQLTDELAKLKITPRFFAQKPDGSWQTQQTTVRIAS